jgi:hypothetical protein
MIKNTFSKQPLNTLLGFLAVSKDMRADVFPDPGIPNIPIAKFWLGSGAGISPSSASQLNLGAMILGEPLIGFSVIIYY